MKKIGLLSALSMLLVATLMGCSGGGGSDASTTEDLGDLPSQVSTSAY